jgi:heme/copper-type cytochrome/quinol oxidase subunit 2
VLALDFRMTPASTKYLADKANSAGRLLTLVKVVVPIALIVIGVLLTAVAAIRRRKPVSPSGPSAAETDRTQRAVPMDTALPR